MNWVVVAANHRRLYFGYHRRQHHHKRRNRHVRQAEENRHGKTGRVQRPAAAPAFAGRSKRRPPASSPGSAKKAKVASRRNSNRAVEPSLPSSAYSRRKSELRRGVQRG